MSWLKVKRERTADCAVIGLVCSSEIAQTCAGLETCRRRAPRLRHQETNTWCTSRAGTCAAKSRWGHQNGRSDRARGTTPFPFAGLCRRLLSQFAKVAITCWMALVYAILPPTARCRIWQAPSMSSNPRRQSQGV